MELSSQYYPDFNASTVESLWLTMARQLNELQKSGDTNPNTVTIITIATDENEEKTSVELSEITGNILDGKNVVNNPFNADFTPGTNSSWPFSADNLLQAICDVGMWLANKQTDADINIKQEFILNYSIENNEEIATPHFQLSLGADEIPLLMTGTGESLTTQARSWLEGSI